MSHGLQIPSEPKLGSKMNEKLQIAKKTGGSAPSARFGDRRRILEFRNTPILGRALR